MNSALFFVLGIVAIVVGLGFAVYKTPGAAKAFWDSSKGKNVLGGILMVMVVVVLWAFFGNKANADTTTPTFTYLNYVEMFVGLDYDVKNLNFCRSNGFNNKLTSNVGFRGNLVRTYDRKAELNIKYQHHSCAFEQDKPTYDAVGIEFTYVIGDK